MAPQGKMKLIIYHWLSSARICEDWILKQAPDLMYWGWYTGLWHLAVETSTTPWGPFSFSLAMGDPHVHKYKNHILFTLRPPDS